MFSVSFKVVPCLKIGFGVSFWNLTMQNLLLPVLCYFFSTCKLLVHLTGLCSPPPLINIITRVNPVNQNKKWENALLCCRRQPGKRREAQKEVPITHRAQVRPSFRSPHMQTPACEPLCPSAGECCPYWSQPGPAALWKHGSPSPNLTKEGTGQGNRKSWPSASLPAVEIHDLKKNM